MANSGADSSRGPGASGGKPASPLKGLVILGLLGVVILLGVFYKDQIGAFVKLRKWDSGAPGRVAVQFLKDGKAGDQVKTDKNLSAMSIKPIVKDGKFLGYASESYGRKEELLFGALCPEGEPNVESTVFDDIDEVAVVTVKDAKGQPVRYRMRQKEDGWKVDQILPALPAK